MPATGPSSATALRAAMRGVAAFVLDADGVLFLKGRAIPGSLEAVARLEALGLPYRVMTNYSMAHRTTLAATLAGTHGRAFDPDRIITASSAAAAYTAAHHAAAPIVVVAAPDARREFDGQALVPLDQAVPGEVAAVVIGDAGDELSYRAMDRLFGLIRAGAAFLAMHRNPWWLTPKGPTLDAGAVVAGLEYATGRRASVLGKPSPEVFRQALAAIRAEAGGPIAAGRVAMVGDDPDADVRAAQRVGLRGILVLSGKTAIGDLGGERLGRGRRAPDAIAGSLADVVAALD
ncbi:MAG: HAD-IIA family hydrolase [Candidatus Limnocylindria bacterium]